MTHRTGFPVSIAVGDTRCLEYQQILCPILNYSRRLQSREYCIFYSNHLPAGVTAERLRNISCARGADKNNLLWQVSPRLAVGRIPLGREVCRGLQCSRVGIVSMGTATCPCHARGTSALHHPPRSVLCTGWEQPRHEDSQGKQP